MARFLLLFLVSITHLSLFSEEERGGRDETVQEENENLILTPTPKWKDKSPSYYNTPVNSSRGVKGTNFPYTLWYDGIVWEESKPLNENAEKSFSIPSKNIDAIIVADKKQIALDAIDNIVIENAKKSGFQKAAVISIEKRKVNGKDIVFVHWQAVLQQVPADFLSYLYSDENGSVFLHTYTPSLLFKKNHKEMEDFLNGLTIDEK